MSLRPICPKARKLKVLLAFIFLLWLILGLFETPAVQGGPIFFETVMPFFNGQGISICFDWYDQLSAAISWRINTAITQSFREEGAR